MVRLTLPVTESTVTFNESHKSVITGHEMESGPLPGDFMFMVSVWILIFGYGSEGGILPISECCDSTPETLSKN